MRITVHPVGRTVGHIVSLHDSTAPSRKRYVLHQVETGTYLSRKRYVLLTVEMVRTNETEGGGLSPSLSRPITLWQAIYATSSLTPVVSRLLMFSVMLRRGSFVLV